VGDNRIAEYALTEDIKKADTTFTKYYSYGGTYSQSIKINNYNVVNPGSSITSYYNGTTYDNNLSELAGSSPYTPGGKAVGCRCTVMTLESPVIAVNGNAIGGLSNAYTLGKPLFNYKIIKANLYGGTSERALANTIYISTGHYQRIDSSVLADTYDAGTESYIFDEVDAGVGGKAAIEVGRRLALLARDAQVIVVTHLPQVAAWADSHFVVKKSSDGSIVASGVNKLAEAERINEIARMLAGLEESASAQEHAAELLAMRANG
jgi:hypothetical protein